jgi:thioredoxin-like negative regulator of GroEL
VFYSHLYILSALTLFSISSLNGKEETSVVQDKVLPKKLEADITDWEARLDYAYLLSDQKKYHESIIEFQRVLLAQPKSISARYGLAKILYNQQEYSEARYLLEEIPLEGKEKINDDAQLFLVDINLVLKDNVKAEMILQKQIKKNPEDFASRYKLGKLLSTVKRYKESYSVFRSILAQKPDDIQVRRQYAMVLMQLGEFEEAAAEMQKTLLSKTISG